MEGAGPLAAVAHSALCVCASVNRPSVWKLAGCSYKVQFKILREIKERYEMKMKESEEGEGVCLTKYW